MKIKIDIDCTPGEARAFLGLPDVAPMQEAVLLDIQNRMKEAMADADMESLVKTWMPSGMQGFDTMQKAFWAKAMGKSDD
ncbi:MAG: hypothetical protein HOK21_04755 [Rhodospirillaceae bacterium]|jgi:hypothetical protein|nr:hypothetical protein [Rhodospirillaceae bacterium]MBT4044277.1 hypothetical protein [Rhodospirillaceae bacterium]MBT4687869.1 hypothetical protein [Rhodospirillaceae bacterium]MBT5079487.1 hypothetical protein [Rhodospirillaceae bacterium]MBT5523373.1 hypothetical protein [Rhodospirillaceae bacterium]